MIMTMMIIIIFMIVFVRSNQDLKSSIPFSTEEWMKNICLSEKSFCHHQEEEVEILGWVYGTFNLHFGVEISSKLKNSAGNLNSLLTSQCIITERVGSQICVHNGQKMEK